MQQPRGLVKLRPSVSTYSFFELAARVAAHSVAVRTRNGSNAAFLQTLAPANTDFSLRFPPVRIMKVSPEKKNSKRKKISQLGSVCFVLRHEDDLVRAQRIVGQLRRASCPRELILFVI
jgi:hypothetical protein